MQLRRRRTHKYTRAFFGALVVLVVLTSATSASAQRRKKIVLSEFVIEGRVQKPQAFVILQRQNMKFDGLTLDKSFVKKIIKTADEQPF